MVKMNGKEKKASGTRYQRTIILSAKVWKRGVRCILGRPARETTSSEESCDGNDRSQQSWAEQRGQRDPGLDAWTCGECLKMTQWCHKQQKDFYKTNPPYDSWINVITLCGCRTTQQWGFAGPKPKRGPEEIQSPCHSCPLGSSIFCS